MNKLEEILEILKFDEINNAQWKTQESNSSSILFYNLGKGEEKKVQAESLLRGTSYHTLILCSDENLNLNNCIVLNDNEFIKLQEIVLDKLYPIKKDIVFFGVTGTNGKTTTVDLIRQLVLMDNKTIMTVGTLGVYLNDEKIADFGLTTPNYIDLRKTLFNNQNNYQFVAMELSSHALVQKRIGFLQFDQIGWTNLTQDHLDYHKTMEEYFNAKLIVFDKLKAGGKLIIPSTQLELREKILRNNIEVSKLELKSQNPFLQVQYNRDNLEVAVNLLKNYINTHKFNFDRILAPPGRFNIIEYKSSYIIIDFAHTADALESISFELTKSFPDKKLKVLFGCGGDRDKTKRPLMAQAAQKYASFVYLTSDNPRFEEPEAIIEDAAKGFTNTNFLKIVDRKEAIARAIKDLRDDVLLIAGKGHENYIDEMGVKRDYSDSNTVKGCIND